MPISPLETAGAQIQPTSAAPLHTNEFFTGLWTNGNPLGPGAVPFLYQRFYSAQRYDRLIDGLNIEISTRLTPIRRPGHTVYNPGPFPAIARFYEFRGFTATDEVIRLMADCDGAPGSVREVTQPTTNTVLWTKAAGAGRTSFVSDGNTLYAGDGTTTHKWVASAASWTAGKQWNTGDFIVDSNNNIEQAVGAQTANIAYIKIVDVLIPGPPVSHQRIVTLWFSSATPLNVKNGVSLNMAGLTTVPFLNGTSGTLTRIVSATQMEMTFTFAGTLPPVTAYSAETGTASTGTGISGGSVPAWNPTQGQVTQDGGNQWYNAGGAVQPWGGAGPASAPTITQTVTPSIYPQWQANTWYAPGGTFVILDSNGNLQQLVGPAAPTVIQTGAAAPTWATTPGTITTESGGSANAQWKCVGPSGWIANTAYAVGASVVATYTYYITVPVTTYTWNGYTQVPTVTLVQQPVTATSLFVCTQAGTSGPATPNWTNGVGTVTAEASPSTVAWKNAGNAPAWPGATQTLSLAAKVMDTHNNVETAQQTAESGATVTWTSGGLGSVTVDGAQTWVNGGPYGSPGNAPWQWAYSGKNSITGEISTASPISLPFTPPAGYLPVIQGQGMANPPWDTIVLWRTQAGGSTLLYEDQFTNPGPTQTWIYTDSNPDSLLNLQQMAPIAGTNGNDPPDSSFIPICFYLGRIWGFVNNQLRWTGGPDTVTGAGNSTMPSKNRFTFPAKGVMLWPTSIGLIVFTSSDMWAVLGQGTSQSPFYAVNFQAGIGMASQDAFGVNGSTAYAMITSHQVMSMDPGAGEVEVGFPIGDLFDANFDPALAYVTWHQGSNKDSAVYVANGDSYWHRMAAVAAPESGNVWSPAAVMAAPGRVKAMASIEISPGHKVLVAGPAVAGNAILKRDYSVNSDNAVAYAAHGTVASVILAQPGGTAGLQFVVTEEKMIAGASPVVVKILFDEILFGSPDITIADFRQLRNITPDPPNLPPSKSVLTQRHWAAQDASTVITCRHYQQDFSWPAEDHPSELFTNTIYGRLPQKARK